MSHTLAMHKINELVDAAVEYHPTLYNELEDV